MLYYRIAGAVIVAISGVAGAYILNSSAKGALIQAEAFISLLRSLRSDIECFAMPIPKALLRCPAELYRRCGYQSDVPPNSIEQLIDGCRILDPELRRRLEGFCRSVGRGYREEQLALFDYCLGQLEERRRVLCDQLPSKRKMNSALCLSGALAIVILLI